MDMMQTMVENVPEQRHHMQLSKSFSGTLQ